MEVNRFRGICGDFVALSQLVYRVSAGIYAVLYTLFSKSYKKTVDEITSLIYFVTKFSNIIW